MKNNEDLDSFRFSIRHKSHRGREIDSRNSWLCVYAFVTSFSCVSAERSTPCAEGGNTRATLSKIIFTNAASETFLLRGQTHAEQLGMLKDERT